MSTTRAEPAKPSLHLLSCSELFRLREAKRDARNGPQPWLLRKLTVAIVVLIIGWTTYVYIGRVCVGLIRREQDIVGSRGLGITFLILFSLLWLFFVWSYAKIVLTPPGFASDHVPKSPRPGPPTFETPHPRRLEPADTPNSHRSTPSYPPIPRTRKPSDWSSTDDGGWSPSGLPPPDTYAVSDDSRPDIHSYTTREQEKDPGAGREPSLSSPDSAAAAEQSRQGGELDIVEVGGTEGSSGKQGGSARTTRPSTAGSRILPGSPPPPGSSNSTTRSGPAATPLSPIDDHRPSTGSNLSPYPHHPSHSITSALSMQTGSTLIHQGSTNNNDTDVTDRDDYPGDAEEDEDAKRRGNPTSPAPCPDSRSPSSRPKSRPPQLLPERANQDQSFAEALADSSPSAIYPPSSPTAPRASQHQQDQNDSFQRVNGRHVPSTEIMDEQNEDDLPPPLYSRRPPTAPILDDDFRYCQKDELIKPYRTHHCRTCGTCVLYYDHHCPWIGQCVGARNRKFFVNFLIWCVAFTTYVIATLLPIVVITGNHTAAGGDLIDGQVVGVIGAAIVFLLFSSTLLSTHVHLLMYNASTVEWYGFQRMRQRERLLLGEMFPPCVGGPCGDRRDHLFGEYRETADKDGDEESDSWCCRLNPSARQDKKQTRKAWDAEWGRIGKEGNLWWVDASPDDPHSQQISGKRRQWEEVMGRSVWEWLLPIGDTKQKGLDYRPNPRFDTNGRWRKRREWPEGFR